jgi:2-oxo-4-hydroxy-4-carboxy-5-ureidoimidazoline decarboxylase
VVFLAEVQLSIPDLNAANREAFAQALGFVFERSPWIAQQTWALRPFRDREHLYHALCDVVARADVDAKLALIRAHPDLAGKAAIAGQLTTESTREQASAGLDTLSAEQFAEFTRLNTAYRERFAFPFIICVREHTRQGILRQFETRLEHDRTVEVETALAEIAKIARLRLFDGVAGEQ